MTQMSFLKSCDAQLYIVHAGLWTRSNTACWSPGMQAPPGQALAESVVLRGARRGGAPLQSHQASDLLDQSLMLEGDLPS